MKSKGLLITLIVILAIIALCLIAGMTLFIIYGGEFNFMFSKIELIDTYEAEAVSIEKVNVDMKSYDVEIKQGESEKFVIEHYSNKENKLKYKVENNTIQIGQPDVQSHFFNNNHGKIVISVPKGYLGEFDIYTTSGDVSAQKDLTENKVSIKATSGDINLEAIKNGRIETTSGNVRLEKSKGDTSIEVTSGDVNIEDAEGKIYIKVTSGDISINKFDIKESSSITTTSGDVRINDLSECYVEADTKSGDKNIKNNDRKSDIVLNVKTSSGNINV